MKVLLRISRFPVFPAKKKPALLITPKCVSANAADRPEPEYLTLQEAAGLAGISRQALCKYIEQGAIEGVEKYAGRIRLPKQEFGKWMIRRMLREEAADGVD